MSDATVFAMGMAGTIAIDLAVVAYLRPPLERILVELCGSQERAGFWTAFSAVALGLTPLTFAIGWRPLAMSSSPEIFELADQLKLALIGLMITLLVLGWAIGKSIMKRESRQTATKNPAQPVKGTTEAP